MSSTASGAAARSVAANDAFARPGRSAGGRDGRRPSSSSSGSVDPGRARLRPRSSWRASRRCWRFCRCASRYSRCCSRYLGGGGRGRSNIAQKLRGAKIARPKNCARAGGALALLLAVLRELELALLLREEAALAPPRRRRLGRRALRRGGRRRGRRRRRRAQQLVALRGERRREDGGRRDPPHAAAHGPSRPSSAFCRSRRRSHVGCAFRAWRCAPAALANALLHAGWRQT